MKTVAALLLGTLLISGCGHAVTGTAPVRAAGVSRVADVDGVFQADVTRGFTLIFNAYDQQPKDGKLSFAEFGHVVDREWFTAHDTNHDGFIPLTEWLTPAEMASQVADLKASGPELLKRADKNHDGTLTLPEFLADVLEVDATPWLAGPADKAIKADAFKRFMEADGTMSADRISVMLGDLLAQGYYLDDGTAGLKLAR